MRTRMAPSYANIIMGKVENEFFQTVDKTPTVWWSCIDEIFVIWPHGEECLKQLIHTNNNMHCTSLKSLQLSGLTSPLHF